MRRELALLLLLAVVGITAAGVLSSPSAGSAPKFDYAAATPEEREQYLEKLAGNLNSKFSPNFIAKSGTYTTGGRSITYSYNMRVSKVDCDTDDTCEVMQCRRYLDLPVSAQNISVRIKYLNAKGKQIGSQLLKNSSCEAILKKYALTAAS